MVVVLVGGEWLGWLGGWWWVVVSGVGWVVVCHGCTGQVFVLLNLET